MKSFRFHLLAVLAAGVLLAGCSEEQVLYVAESEEEIPPVPDFPTDRRRLAEHEAQLHGTGAPLGDPVREPFATPPRREDLRDYHFEGITVELPERFELLPTQAEMRLAEFRIPGPEGEEGELIVYHFGLGQGGSARENAHRWHGQFVPTPPAETPLRRYQQHLRDGLLFTRITLEGTWTSTAMPGAAAPEPLDNWGLDGLIIEGGHHGSLFLRLTGPRELVRVEDTAISWVAATATAQEREGVAEASPLAAEELPAGALELPGVVIPIPEHWEEAIAAGPMRRAEYRIPPAPDAEPGEFVVFYFGEEGGGTTQANLDRWEAQVTNQTAEPQRRVFERGSFTIHTIRLEGTYGGIAPGPRAPAPGPQPGSIMIGAVVEGGAEGPLYLRFTGPRETILREDAAIQAVIDNPRAR